MLMYKEHVLHQARTASDMAHNIGSLRSASNESIALSAYIGQVIVPDPARLMHWHISDSFRIALFQNEICTV